MRHSIVITTINSPTESLERVAKGALNNGWELIVAGDAKTPNDQFANRDDINFISSERQCSKKWNLSRIVPENTYARKVFGYLEAFVIGSDYVIDTDDDNWPLEDFFIARNNYAFASASDGKCISFINSGWINIYQNFCPSSNVWPRGFPLSEIKRPIPFECASYKSIDSIIYQGLAEGSPDVDAVHRLVFPYQEYIFNSQRPIEIRSGAFCPFNSQNTTWQKDSFFMMYLPFTCSFRMTDIYRSYIAQRITHEMQRGILFHHATVHQDRNIHSIISDFRDEVMCYLDNGEFMNGLKGLDLKNKSPSEMLLSCYRYAIDKRYFKTEELEGVAAWIKDLESIGVI